MNDLQLLLDDIRDELSTDVYYVHQNTRNFLLESIAAAIAMACLLDYVKGFVNPSKIGEKHRQYLKRFVEDFREQKITSIAAEMKRLDDEANTLIKALPGIDDQKERAAIDDLRLALIEIGMPSQQADRHAKGVATLVKNHLLT